MKVKASTKTASWVSTKLSMISTKSPLPFRCQVLSRVTDHDFSKQWRRHLFQCHLHRQTEPLKLLVSHQPVLFFVSDNCSLEDIFELQEKTGSDLETVKAIAKNLSLMVVLFTKD